MYIGLKSIINNQFHSQVNICKFKSRIKKKNWCTSDFWIKMEFTVNQLLEVFHHFTSAIIMIINVEELQDFCAKCSLSLVPAEEFILVCKLFIMSIKTN